MGRAKRRNFLIALGGLLTARLAFGQTGRRTYRIGSVYLADSATTRPYEESFLAGLQELGFERGKNLIYDVRNCDGDPARLPAAVDEVLALKPDVMAGIEHVAQVMRSKTATTPIVLVVSTDPVAAGLAKSLSRPGGNVTGMAALTREIAIKQLEMLKELLPQMKAVAFLLDPNVPALDRFEERASEATKAMRIKSTLYRAKDRAGLIQAFAAMERDRPDGIVLAGGSGTLFGERHFIADNARRLGLPCAGGAAAAAEVGYLFSYGASIYGLHRRAASYAARILNGANAAELPIEQASTFELVLNLKTANALKIKVPQSILVRADRVIE
jgi:putative ABC transport system substrate-binding protein